MSNPAGTLPTRPILPALSRSVLTLRGVTQALRGLHSSLVVAALLSAGCATGSGRYATSAAEIVIVNGEPVAVHHHRNLLDVLALRREAILGSASQVDEPLLIVDGVRQTGAAARLAEIRVEEVRRVTVLRAPDAFTRFGPEAINGAIVVETQGGLRR